MVTGLKSYKLWRACHLHFTNESYDVVEYKGRIKNVEQSYNKLSSLQKYRFEWLGKNHKDEKSLCNTLIACYLDGINPVYDEKQSVRTSGISFTGRKQSIHYILKSQLSDYLDCLRLNNIESIREDLDDITRVSHLMMLIQDKSVCPELALILDMHYNYLDAWYDELVYIGFKTNIFVLRKYRSLFNTQKYYDETFGQAK